LRTSPWHPCPNSSSAHLHRPETESFNVELSNLDITEEDLLEVFRYLLKAELFKAEDLADENPPLMPADIATVVHSPGHEALGIYEVIQGTWKYHRT
jgi:hypothetical protein